MKRKFTKLMAALALLVFIAPSMVAWGQTTVTYTQSSTSAVGVTSGTAPTGSSASFSTTYTNMNQLTAGNSMTLTLSGYQGKKITGITLSMKSNSSKGAGTLSVTAGSTTLASISPAANFNSSSWYGAWSTSYVDVVVAMSNNNYTIQANENVVVTIAATVNSLYCQSFTFTYEDGTGPALDPCDLALTDAPVELEFDLYNNNTAQVIHYTTSSTGEVSVAQNDYITATVNQQNKTITVTPIAVTNGAKTIRVNQAPDEDYASGYVEFTVDIEDSTPFTGGDVTFVAGTDMGSTTTNADGDEMTKRVVTVSGTSAAFATPEYRMYSGSTTTISTSFGTIVQIVFTGVSGATNYYISNLALSNGSSGTFVSDTQVDPQECTWTGNAASVSFTANGQARASQIVVTVAAPVNVATPTFDPEGGVYLASQNVEISCETDDVAIYYTIDGSDPDESSTLYNEAITISTTTTLKAVAIKNGESSYIGEATYTFPAVSTIAAARALNNNEYALVQGVVTFIDGRNVYVQDATAGICLYLNSETVPSTLALGDMVKAYGKKTAYNGLVELGSIDGGNSNEFVIVSHDNDLPLAVKTIEEILAGADGNLQSTRVKIEGAEIGEINTSGDTPLTQGTNTVNLYKVPTLAETIEEGDFVNVIGVIGYYNAAQIRVASADDVTEVELQSFELEIEAENGTVAVYIGEEQQTGTEGSYMIPQGSVVTLTPTPVQNYRFVEWQVEAEQGTVTITDNQFTMPSCYVLVQAVFEEIPSYTYAYSINGVQGQATSVQEGTEITLNSSSNYNESFTFAGWTTVANDFTTILPANSTYTVMEDVVFYAVYAQTITSTPEERVVILDGDATGLSSTQTSVSTQSTLTENGFSYVATGVKYQALASSATNNFSTGKTVLIGKKNAYLYNTTSFGDGITKFEIYHNGGNVSTTVTVAVQFAAEPITQFNEQGAWTATLDQADHVFDVTVPEGAKYFYYTVTNDKNSQDQFRITYVTSGSTTTYYTNISSYPLSINGYTDVTEGTNNKGYYLIASPVTVDPATVEGMTEGDFDLYYFDADEDLEWRNYEAEPFNLVPGKGYLYAKKATTETPSYSFTLTGAPYNGNEIERVMGWNLVGNPYATAASLNMPFYRMNPEGSALVSVTEGNVTAMEGVFIEITEEDLDPETGDMPNVEFTPVNGKSVAALNLNLSQNRGSVIDNAIVRFDNGKTLSKFQFREGSTKLYIPQGNQDFAIVRSAAEAEMPVSFKASENGTYTLAVEAENVEMNYLHLIDNMTGMDVDLLQTPSYTFEAKTSDYASRFRLVFKASSTSSEADETFAYFNGTNWTVSNVGDATLQVVDVTGRTVANQMINGNAELNLNQPAGVYVIRLVNGDNVKTQKVVVR